MFLGFNYNDKTPAQCFGRLNNVWQHSGSEYEIKKETQKIIRSYQFVHDEK